MIQRLASEREADSAGKFCTELSAQQIDALARMLLSLAEAGPPPVQEEQKRLARCEKPGPTEVLQRSRSKTNDQSMGDDA
ncbi:MAG: hypothetical protein AAFX06_28125 [Planctomycetota bacterium]